MALFPGSRSLRAEKAKGLVPRGSHSPSPENLAGLRAASNVVFRKRQRSFSSGLTVRNQFLVSDGSVYVFKIV